MKKRYVAVLLSVVFLCLGCGKESTEKPEEPPVIKTLLSNLEYPKGLWVEGGKVYFTEASGRAGYGGKNALSVYDPVSNMRAVLLDTIVCTEGVVVTDEGNIYMTSWIGSVPGDDGEVSYDDPLHRTELVIVRLAIACVDMFIDTNDDIWVIGSSETPDANSVYRLPVADYTNPEVIYHDLGKAQCLGKSGDNFYWSDEALIRRFFGQVEQEFATRGVESMSLSSTYLFYADRSAGRIGKIRISPKADEAIATGLHSPIAVRWDAVGQKLYFLEAGTSAQQYKDGTLKVITGIH
jgi:hypothetical protein